MYNRLTMRINQKIDTTERWEQYNPVLLNGEFGIERCGDYCKIKIGNGVDPWLNLKYLKIKDDKCKKSNSILIISIISVLNAIVTLGNLVLLLY